MYTGGLVKYVEYLALGSQIAAAMLLPVLLGIYADRHWNISPWGIIIGTLLGFGGMISIVLKLLSTTQKDKYKKK